MVMLTDFASQHMTTPVKLDWDDDTFKFILDPGQPAKLESVSPTLLLQPTTAIQLLWTVRLKLMLPYD